MYLLIDAGNTAIKIVLVENKQIINQVILESNKLLKTNQIYKKLENEDWSLNEIKLIALCSVKPVWDKVFEDFSKLLNVKFYQVKKNLQILDFKVNVENPKVLGADLLINSYSGVKKYPNQNLIILSFGTATTITIVKNKALEGTIIMPGLKISAQTLFDNASLLKKFNYSYSSKYIGKNTEDAINIGVVNGHLCGVQGLINNIKKYLERPLILITGGNNFRYELFFSNYRLEPNLLFEGMMEIIG